MTTSDRLLAALDLFDVDRPDWSVEEAAARLGLATSTMYRYFASLTASGMLAPFATGRYVLGPTIIRYDRLLRLTDPLILAGHDEMQRIAAGYAGRCVVFLCRYLAGQVMCVDQAASGDPQFALAYQRGRPMPLFAGSASKVILAQLPSRHLKALHMRDAEAFARAGLGAGWEQVRATLRAIRNTPVLITNGEIDPGMRGISVPLVIQDGSAIASLSVAGPQALLSETDDAEIGEMLRQSASAVLARMRR